MRGLSKRQPLFSAETRLSYYPSYNLSNEALLAGITEKAQESLASEAIGPSMGTIPNRY